LFEAVTIVEYSSLTKSPLAAFRQPPRYAFKMKYLLPALLALILLSACSTTHDRAWKTGAVEHEGVPLYLRFPDGLDYDTLQKTYPQLIVLKQQLLHVNDKGAPQADHNDSLGEFDTYIVNFLEKSGNGITVLVETFGGKRIYYMYSKTSIDASAMESAIRRTYPEHSVTISAKSDREWGFIRRYAREWKF